MESFEQDQHVFLTTDPPVALIFATIHISYTVLDACVHIINEQDKVYNEYVSKSSACRFQENNYFQRLRGTEIEFPK